MSSWATTKNVATPLQTNPAPSMAWMRNSAAATNARIRTGGRSRLALHGARTTIPTTPTNTTQRHEPVRELDRRERDRERRDSRAVHQRPVGEHQPRAAGPGRRSRSGSARTSRSSRRARAGRSRDGHRSVGTRGGRRTPRRGEDDGRDQQHRVRVVDRHERGVQLALDHGGAEPRLEDQQDRRRGRARTSTPARRRDLRPGERQDQRARSRHREHDRGHVPVAGLDQRVVAAPCRAVRTAGTDGRSTSASPGSPRPEPVARTSPPTPISTKTVAVVTTDSLRKSFNVDGSLVRSDGSRPAAGRDVDYIDGPGRARRAGRAPARRDRRPPVAAPGCDTSAREASPTRPRSAVRRRPGSSPASTPSSNGALDGRGARDTPSRPTGPKTLRRRDRSGRCGRWEAYPAGSSATGATGPAAAADSAD